MALALARLGKLLGFAMTIIDDRPFFANQARAVIGQSASQKETDSTVLCEAFEEALVDEPGSLQTYFVVMTRGHRYDMECLKSILKKPYAYVGMMGSKGRAIRVRELLLQEGYTGAEELHSPIGLSIGAKTPEEIAVSVMAELIQVRSIADKEPIQVRDIANKEKENADQQNQKQNQNRNPYGIEMSEEVFHALQDETDCRRLLAVITERRGSAPRTVGTTMAVFADGRTAGTIGGGCMEAEVIREALLDLKEKNENTDKPKLIELQMLPEEAETEGMACGGVISVELIESIFED